ncbi:hypothetical protein [Pedobacter antarcticus]|uniref:hypothetical protein n=1 Tax=Pedobacter antarcticus TaxID=34086 RepID=UPI001C588C5A|nr:hypothetical protein [Pedobacter antarcticus]
MIKEIKKGDRLICIKYLSLRHLYVDFIEGEVYNASKNHTIKNKLGIAGWDIDVVNEHFRLAD